ncbi:SagB/ThcOx family dehydrogenase [Methylosoma difficile]
MIIPMKPAIASIHTYHQRTKHSLQAYAKGPETIDWEDQPEPFRRFIGCLQQPLPKPGRDLPVLFTDLDQPEAIAAQPFTLDNVGLLLELAFGLSAWKQFGPSRWALRCNPSSGNLHPTEAYLIASNNVLIPAGVYHYVSHDHALEQRALFAKPTVANGLFIGLSSIHWREAWKYGERAFRYCQHDIGHALGALRYAAAVLGWSIDILNDVADAELASLLGLGRQDDFKPREQESPDVLCRITVSGQAPIACQQILDLLPAATWFGRAESLKAYHLYHWSVIDDVAEAAAKPHTFELPWREATQPVLPSSCPQPATQIIRQRRSAQQFDGKMQPLPAADFYRMLSAVLPSSAALACWQAPPQVHLFIFVHRVEGLTPGLYALLRDESMMPALQMATSSQFDWQKQHALLPFYHLYSGDLKQVAKTLSCHQPIASDSAFSLAMVGNFAAVIGNAPWQYRRLFWECGLIGQVLYLEAEAAGVRGTGIGCYFDDSVHEILGIEDDTFQSLYHFTVGKPLEDRRLQTLPPYSHLQGES